MLFAAVLFAAALAGFALSAAAQPVSTSWECPAGLAAAQAGQPLHVLNWAEYITSDVLAAFEDRCGIAILYEEYGTTDDLLARVRAAAAGRADGPPYDVIIGSQLAISALIRDGLLAPLSPAETPNRANLASDRLGLSFDPGNTYTLPYLVSYIGIGYNQDRIAEPLDRWSDMFLHEGPVAWVDNPRQMIGAALNLLDLDPNSTDPRDIRLARDLLITQGNNVVAIVPVVVQDLLASGEVDIVVEYTGDLYGMIEACACETFRFFIPAEGSAIEIDSLAIPAQAQHPQAAHAFIDYLLDAQVAAALANATGFATPNQAAIDGGLIRPDLLANPGLYPPPGARLFFITDDAEADSAIGRAWEELKITLGR
jgi:spermidine/putrescine transport system substrate-binding protein